MSVTELPVVSPEELEAWSTLPTPLPTRPLPAKIEREADRLDRLFPGWADRIDISKLDMQSPKHCVLGQGAYGRTWGFRRPLRFRRSIRTVVADGGCDWWYCCNEDRAAWIAEINKRRPT